MRYTAITATLALAAAASHAADPVETEVTSGETAAIAGEPTAAVDDDGAAAAEAAPPSVSAKAAQKRGLVSSDYDPDNSVLICRSESRTGSRLVKKRCKTAAQIRREAAHRRDTLQRNSSRIPRTQPAFKFPDK